MEIRVFRQADFEEVHSTTITAIPYVQRFISFGGEPLPVPEDVMAELLWRQSHTTAQANILRKSIPHEFAEILLMEKEKSLMRKQNKKSKKQNMDINYLDLIPETNQSIRWHRDLKQRIILEIENKGMFNTIAQKVFGKPRFSKVHLDEMGTFIWPEIDGAKTVQELALLVKEHFGDKAEPLYPRIVKYFQIMESYEFVHFINKKTEK